jgi:peptidyl-prolyl cis-trans isomerase C
MQVSTAMKRLLREPLLHFLALGVALFLVYGYLAPRVGTADVSHEIRLTPDELAQMIMVFESQWRRDPTPAEFNELVESKIQEEVLYREALSQGLDKDDEIVRRRMAQKMQFLAEDVAAAHEPTTTELRSWFEKNKAMFALPPRISFRHLYFSPDKRGTHTRQDAERALEQLAGQPEDSKLAASLGDPFMFQDYYRDRAPDYIGKEFGPQFAVALEKLPPESWQGPVASGFGWHLVYIDTVVPGRIPAFEEIEPDVKTAWLGIQKEQARRKAYEAMRAKYTVVLPGPPGTTGGGQAPRAAATPTQADRVATSSEAAPQ